MSNRSQSLNGNMNEPELVVAADIKSHGNVQPRQRRFEDIGTKTNRCSTQDAPPTCRQFQMIVTGLNKSSQQVA